MKYSFKKGKIIIWLVIIFSIVVLTCLTIPYFFLKNREPETDIPLTPNIEAIVEEIKASQSAPLVYESTKLKGIVSLVYEENARYKSFIIDTKTGQEIEFPSLIKTEQQEAFHNKEIELLNLKYPEFIVNTIINNNPTRFYYVKDNEIIIYYYDLELPYNMTEQISLKINYNEIKNMLLYTPIYDLEYQNENAYDFSSNKKSVALTFDDGPTKKYNHYFLEALARNKAHATFFMVGNMMQGCPECVKNTYDSGNEIGSHSYEHMNLKTHSIASFQTSLQKVEDIYTALTGAQIKLVRPPYGAYNKTNLENINTPLILWNLDTEDWRYHDVNHIVEYIKNNVSDGSIILMHELYETSYQALDEILPWLYANGYNVVSISELAKLKNKPLEANHAYYNFK